MVDIIYDVIIIGLGLGGYVIVICFVQLGFKIVIVECEYLGGICFNWGCILIKVLLCFVEIMDYVNYVKSFGLMLDGFMKVDVKDVVVCLCGVLVCFNGGVGFLMKKNKIDVIWGEVKFIKFGQIVVGKLFKLVVELQYFVLKGVKGEGIYIVKYIIVVIGVCLCVLFGIELDGKLIWIYFEVMKLVKMLKLLVVMGFGVIGIEFVFFYCFMGVDVIVIELMVNVMLVEDVEIFKFVCKVLEKCGLKIIIEVKVIKVDKVVNFIIVYVEGKDGKVIQIMVDYLIFVVGV